MKYRLEVYNDICDRICNGPKIKDLFLEGCKHVDQEGFRKFTLLEDKTGEKIFTLKGE